MIRPMQGVQVEVPPGIAGLAPDAADRVQALVEQARARQLRELGEALDHTMRLVPRPLRGVVRKVLGV